MEKELVMDMEWQESPEVNIAREFRKKEAKLKMERFKNKENVKSVIKDIIDKVIPTSTINNIMKLVINESVWEGRNGLDGLEIANDGEMRTEILAMIMIEESCLMAGKLEKEKEKRLAKQDIKIKVWKEQKMMIDLIGGMDNLRLETFSGELLRMWKMLSIIRLKIWFEEVYDEVQPVEMPSTSGLFTYPKEKFSLP